MAEEERLQKYLARCGVASRRVCEHIITSGRVRVNGSIVSELGRKVDPDSDAITVDGRPVDIPVGHEYIALNKPVGVLSSVSDPHHSRTVVSLVGDVGRRIYPVGRLDFDSEGLLLLTDDGELSYRLTHPRYHVDKTYLVTVDIAPEPQALELLRNGIELDDGVTSPARIEQVHLKRRVAPPSGATFKVTIHEGKKRQIRRMFARVGSRVVTLRRTEFGPVTLGDLPLGRWRRLSEDEVAALRREVGLDKEVGSGRNED